MAVFFGPIGSARGVETLPVMDTSPVTPPTFPELGRSLFQPMVDFGIPGGTGIQPPKPVVPVTPPKHVDPTIDFFNDNVGASQGSNSSGAQTDDAQPQIFGRGTPGATLQVQYYTGDAYAIHDVIVNAEGIWTFTPPLDLLVDQWTFQVREWQQSDWSEEFIIKYTGQDETTLPQTSLDYVSDNEGKITGDVESGAIIDDKSPTLHGKAVPGTTIFIRGAFSDDPNDFFDIGEALVDDKGNWQLEIQLFRGETYNLQVRSELDVEWSEAFQLGVYKDAAIKSSSLSEATPDVSLLLAESENALFSAPAESAPAAQFIAGLDDTDTLDFTAVYSLDGVAASVELSSIALTEELHAAI